MTHMLKTLRQQKAWSQEQLAEISGLSVRTVQRIENGDNISLESAKTLAAAFDTTADIFLNISQTENATPAEDSLKQIEIERTVRRQFKFYRHLFSYIMVSILLIIINLVTNPDYWWFIYPIIGMGIGILFHAFRTFFPNLEEKCYRNALKNKAEKSIKTDL